MRVVTKIGWLSAVVLLVVGCKADVKPHESSGELATGSGLVAGGDASHRAEVDCLLPGQLRTLGNSSYLTPRRRVRVTASECEIRGGEYSIASTTASQKSWQSNTRNTDDEQIYGGGGMF